MTPGSRKLFWLTFVCSSLLTVESRKLISNKDGTNCLSLKVIYMKGYAPLPREIIKKYLSGFENLCWYTCTSSSFTPVYWIQRVNVSWNIYRCPEVPSTIASSFLVGGCSWVTNGDLNSVGDFNPKSNPLEMINWHLKITQNLKCFLSFVLQVDYNSDCAIMWLLVSS